MNGEWNIASWDMELDLLISFFNVGSEDPIWICSWVSHITHGVHINNIAMHEAMLLSIQSLMINARKRAFTPRSLTYGLPSAISPGLMHITTACAGQCLLYQVKNNVVKHYQLCPFGGNIFRFFLGQVVLELLPFMAERMWKIEHKLNPAAKARVQVNKLEWIEVKSIRGMNSSH